MTHTADATTSTPSGAGATLPAIGSALLALIWGAYTLFFIYEVMR